MADNGSTTGWISCFWVETTAGKGNPSYWDVIFGTHWVLASFDTDLPSLLRPPCNRAELNTIDAGDNEDGIPCRKQERQLVLERSSLVQCICRGYELQKTD